MPIVTAIRLAARSETPARAATDRGDELCAWEGRELRVECRESKVDDNPHSDSRLSTLDNFLTPAQSLIDAHLPHLPAVALVEPQQHLHARSGLS